MAKRVICVMGRMLDQEDGLNVYAANLLKNMISLDTDSLYVILLRTPKHSVMFKEFDNAVIQVVPSRKKTWWDQVIVPLMAKRVKADIVFNPKFSLPLFSRRAGVFVLHGSDWYVNPSCYQWWDNLYIRIMMPVYSWKATSLLAISQRISDDLVRFAKVDPKKITVTYAAPSPHFSPDAEPARLREFAERYRLPETFILSVARAYHTGHGRLPPWPGGNIEGLTLGYQWYRKSGGRLPLVVAGIDIEKYLLSRGFKNSELEGMHFTGFIPHKEIGMAYNLAEFFVLGTLYESFAFPMVEAFASGCPAIVPSTGACPEVAGNAALLVDPRDFRAIGDAMNRLEQSPDLREQLRVAGLERVKNFTWARTAHRTLEVFDNIFRAKKNKSLESHR
jgi:glycosyltransferase involved in cell wall biosynthesis